MNLYPKFKISRSLAALSLALLLGGCIPAPAMLRGATPAPLTLATPTLATATAVATPTSAPSPTLTPSPSATFTPTVLAVLPSFELPKGPDLVLTGKNTEMKIFWQGEAGQPYRLEWGVDASYALGSADVAPTFPQENLYTALIGGLKPGARYLYRVTSGGKATGGSFFAPPPDDATTLKFIAYGDTRTQPEMHDAVAAEVVRLFESDPAYQTLNPMTGDFVNSGDVPEDWDKQLFSPAFKNIRAEFANLAVTPVIGNHEGGGQLFTRYFPMPFVADRYWSFDYGPVHFAMLDQYVDYGKGSAEYDWLQKDLAATHKPWKILVLHEPGWSAGGGHDNNFAVQNDIQPLLKQYGVQIVLGGHNHYYARAVVDGIQHLTVGTGGAPLYTPFPDFPNLVFSRQSTGYLRVEIDGPRLRGAFIDPQGNAIDNFTLSN